MHLMNHKISPWRPLTQQDSPMPSGRQHPRRCGLSGCRSLLDCCDSMRYPVLNFVEEENVHRRLLRLWQRVMGAAGRYTAPGLQGIYGYGYCELVDLCLFSRVPRARPDLAAAASRGGAQPGRFDPPCRPEHRITTVLTHLRTPHSLDAFSSTANPQVILEHSGGSNVTSE